MAPASIKKQAPDFSRNPPSIHPRFGRLAKHEKPLELSELLEQNFLRYDGKGPIPAQIVSWMKQSADLRKMIQEELSAGRANEENGQLITHNSSLITRSKDHGTSRTPTRPATWKSYASAPCSRSSRSTASPTRSALVCFASRLFGPDSKRPGRSATTPRSSP